MVINSNSWKSHFLSGEKKTGAAWRPWPGLAQPGLSGEKKRVPQIEPNPGSGPALAAQQKSQNTKKTLGNKVFWKMLRFWSPQKFPETLKTLGKTRYSGQTRIPPGGGNRKKPYKTNRKWGILSKREAGLRASLGQPAAGKKNGCRLAAMARPG